MCAGVTAIVRTDSDFHLGGTNNKGFILGAQYGLGVVTLLFNNNSFGNVLRDQRVGFGGRVIGASLQNPDFMLLARAFGVAGYRVDSPAALKPGATWIFVATPYSTLTDLGGGVWKLRYYPPDGAK